MRNITIKRESQFVGGGAPFYVFLDGKNIGIIDDEDTATIQVDEFPHHISVCAYYSDDEYYWSNNFCVTGGFDDRRIRVFKKTKLLSVQVIVTSY